MNKKSSYFSLFVLLVLVSFLSVSAAAAQTPEGQAYIIQADDWLSKIAEKEYGDLFAYPSIVEATNAKAAEDDTFAVIDNPDVIEIGQKIWLPATLDGSEEMVGSSEETASEEETVAESETGEQPFEDFDPSNFDDSSTTIDNKWFPLTPGTQWVYEGVTVEDGEETPHRVVFTVTDLTKVIEGIRTVVVWDQDFADGELVERELALFAQDKDGTVWHFGQYPEEYEDGEFVDAPAWIAGVEEARPGISMKAEPQLGTPSYSQGWGPAVGWTDRAQVDQMGAEDCVPVDCYEDVLVMAETSLGEEGAFQLKYYAPGVGNIRVGWRGDDTTQEELELVDLVQLDPEQLAEARTKALELEERAYEVSEDVYGQTAPAEGP